MKPFLTRNGTFCSTMIAVGLFHVVSSRQRAQPDIFMNHMHEYLGRYNSSMPYYLGRANMFAGCAGVKKLGEGPEFAHGSAIVLSKEAMKRVQSHIDQCIVDYMDCFAGDLRTGLCMRDAQVAITRTNEHGWYKFAPNHEFPWPTDPCQPPVVLHHLLPIHIQRLYDIEMKSEGGGTIADVFDRFYRAPSARSEDVTRSGKVYATKQVDKEEDCVKECEANAVCLAWSFEGGECLLRRELGAGNKKKGCVSGAIGERYVCSSKQ
ncbi:hypothetical protein BC830DRAFT_1223601 [Chytriomyces sp. MP71]|nr:hypothetical protein BC830DRAFT_1223601 [Chytriomyces sp. MP71]